MDQCYTNHSRGKDMALAGQNLLSTSDVEGASVSTSNTNLPRRTSGHARIDYDVVTYGLDLEGSQFLYFDG